MQVRDKVEKSPNKVFFQSFVAPEGRKVGSQKRRVRSHLAESCSLRDEKMHAIVARRRFGSENAQSP